MVTTVCFVDDILATFREARRILTPTGRLIIGLVDKTSPLGRLYEKYKEKNKFYRPATFYSTNEIISYLKEAGFGKVQVVQTVFGEMDLIDKIQPFETGFGRGGFVVLEAVTLEHL